MGYKEIKDQLKVDLGPIVAGIIEDKMAEVDKNRAAPSFVRATRHFKPTKLAEMDPEDMTAEQRGTMAGRCVRYLFAANRDQHRALEMAKVNGDKAIVDAWEKAMASDVFATGGALIPPEFASGIIDLLYATSIVRGSGVSVWPMNTGSLTAPFLSSGASAAYVGAEGDNIVPSTPGTGQLQFADKKLAALVAISNDMLRNGGAAADQVIRNNIVRALRLKEDITFIRSNGTLGEPKGLLWWATDGGTVSTANATFNAANAAADLHSQIQDLLDNDVPLAGSVWAGAPRTKIALASLLDGNSNYIYRDELMNPTSPALLGMPFFTSSQIPITGGGGSDETELYLYHAPLAVIAENENLLLDLFPDAAYHDGSAVQSGISRDESALRAIALHDFGCQQRGQEVSVLDTMKWAA